MMASDATIVALELSNDVGAARRARAFVRDAVHSWRLQSGVSDVAQLLTDELVANVVRHVGAPMQVRAMWRRSCIRVEVDDPSVQRPVRRDPDPSEDHGRGILLVESLASAWGVELRRDGKTVWFEVALNGDGRGHER